MTRGSFGCLCDKNYENYKSEILIVAGGGGGATDIRLVSGAWNDFDSLKQELILGKFINNSVNFAIKPGRKMEKTTMAEVKKKIKKSWNRR